MLPGNLMRARARLTPNHSIGNAGATDVKVAHSQEPLSLIASLAKRTQPELPHLLQLVEWVLAILIARVSRPRL